MKKKVILTKDRKMKRGKKVTKMVMILKMDNLVLMMIWVKMSNFRKIMVRKILKWIIRMKDKKRKRKWMRMKSNLNKFSMK